jgi:hypothetical protein
MTVDRFVFGKVSMDRDSGVASFEYFLGDRWRLVERLKLPVLPSVWPSDVVLERILAGVHAALGVSYYKAFCPSIEGLNLANGQAEFWRLFYERGLGEFFYRNQLDFRGRVKFAEGAEVVTPLEWPTQERALVLFSGGKDSIVTVERLKAAGVPMDLLIVGNMEPVRRVAELTGVPILNVGRELDAQMADLNREGWNGHVPLVGILSWIAVWVAAVYGHRWIVLSNESSASEGNTEYLGMNVNHQYSKSFEFEQNFQHYLAEFVSPSVAYFSLLRSMNEVQIARELARFPKYFAEFSSCNRNFKLNERRERLTWCGECSKCAFVFLTLAPFVERGELMAMFGGNLLAKESLWPIYEELLGVARVKPFECVGTPEECRALFLELSGRAEWSGDALVQQFSALDLNAEPLAIILNEHHEDAIPSSFLSLIS